MILYQIVGLDRFAGVIKACPCCIVISAFVLYFDIVEALISLILLMSSL